jgi:hypothetical protein
MLKLSITIMPAYLYKRLLERAAHKGTGALAQTIAKDLLRWSLLYNLRILHKDNVVGHIAGKTHLVRNHNHSHPLFCELAHNF